MSTVWILDDDAGILEALKIILTELNYSVRAFASETSLKKALLESVPDVFLFDVLLAGSNGAQIAKELKSRTLLANIPIILMSAQGRLRELCRLSGAEDFIEKPFNIDDLDKKIKKVVEVSCNPPNRVPRH